MFISITRHNLSFHSLLIGFIRSCCIFRNAPQPDVATEINITYFARLIIFLSYLQNHALPAKRSKASQRFIQNWASFLYHSRTHYWKWAKRLPCGSNRCGVKATKHSAEMYNVVCSQHPNSHLCAVGCRTHSVAWPIFVKLLLPKWQWLHNAASRVLKVAPQLAVTVTN